MGLVVTVVVLTLVSLGCGGGERERDVYEVRVAFTSSSGDLPIETGAPVRIDGEVVGEVGAIEAGSGGTRITTLLIEHEEPLPLDSTFGIESGAVEVDRGHLSDTAAAGYLFSTSNTRPVR